MADLTNLNPREEFGAALRAILSKNRIKMMTIAKVLGVSPGYISQVLTGMALLSESRFGDLCEYLTQNLSNKDEIVHLAAKYTIARAGRGINVCDLVGTTTVQRHFLSLFMQLTCEQQLEILKSMLQFQENNRGEHTSLSGKIENKF